MALYDYKKNKAGKKIADKGNKNPQEIFHESTQRLFHLLANHPHFKIGVADLRKKYKLPYSGITNISQLLVWQKDNKKTFDKLRNDKEFSKLLIDFNVPIEMEKTMMRFALDFITTNNLVTQNVFSTGLNVIRSSEARKTIEMKPDCIYLEITPNTTVREVRDRWEEIVGEQKKFRNFGIPTLSKIEERVWNLYEEGLSTEEVTEKIRTEFKPSKYTYVEIGAFKTNYKKALSKLKKI